jgi:uncharacterized glyoxalase superfamily protein PhnB
MEQLSANYATSRTMPSCSIIPVLTYEDLEKAIDWLCLTFGFTERWRAGSHRAQLAFGDGAIALSEMRFGEVAISSDASDAGKPGGERHSLLVRVADVYQHHELAKRNGAKILKPPVDYHYGERQYSAEDIEGHIWTFSQSIADLAPEDWGGVTGKESV